ncbi:MAG TPA: pyruvate dehydrogenase (acetyl-transferring) E1 component subunit alpha [Chloroflexota bacterium]|nr:pyruvate dehydrogenase (acetyl-transferring) E1 component subunit alpha [Chloroflexota bacterium]
MMKPAEPRHAPHLSAERAAGGLVQTAPGAGLLSPERQAQLVHWYEQMVVIRRFEETAAEMYTRAKIGGYLHLNIGEEATVVGSIDALQPQDYIFSNYREHGHAIARGVEPKKVMAELFGKETGVCKGRGGSMHIFDIQKHFMGGYGIVGGAIPLAVGAGYAIQYRSSAAVVMSIFGEGATNIGAFSESMNLAELWNLPIVFLCVNNRYAMGKPVEEETAVTEIWRKACAYDMAAERVDGMDILAVYEAATRAVDRARQEHGPTLLEAVTYRFRGHSMADAGTVYRTTEEIEQWRGRDPIVSFREKLEQADLLSASRAHEIDQAVDQTIEDAVRFADESPFPSTSTLYESVYCESGETQEDGTGA